MAAVGNQPRRTETEYNRTTVAFDQKRCGLCLDDFKEKDKITLLACKHIFHTVCEKGKLTKCPYDQLEITERDEYVVPAGMPVSDFIAQLATLDIEQAAAEYNQYVEQHTQEIYNIHANNDLGAAYLNVEFQGPEEMETHPRFPTVLKRANERFLRSKIRERNQANCLMKPFYAYRETFGLQGHRFKELCENPDYSNPEVLQMRREFSCMSRLVKRIIAVGAFAILYYAVPRGVK